MNAGSSVTLMPPAVPPRTVSWWRCGTRSLTCRCCARPGELDENGRGLWIVQELSAQCDCYLPPAPHAGKVTRALITTPDVELP